MAYRKQHILEKCTKLTCEIKTCCLRHPRTCRYLRDIGFCKFGEWCLFEHDFVVNGVGGLEDINKKIKVIDKIIEDKSKTIESLAKIIEERYVQMEDKMETFVENLKTLKVCLAEKDSCIPTLEETIVNKKKEFDDFKEKQNYKLDILENPIRKILRKLSS